jgi:hypothetical protein
MMNQRDYSKFHFTTCDGGCEIFEIHRFSGDAYSNFEFSMWKPMCSDRPLGFKERLRWCWNILRTGIPWSDAIIISDTKAKKIANFILTEINKTKTRK